MRKLLSLLLVLALLLPVAAATAEIIGGPGYMYVYTANGKTLNVRSSPNTGDNRCSNPPVHSRGHINSSPLFLLTERCHT